MPEKPVTEKTEQPTAKRLEKARLKGQVAQSQELLSAATLLVLVGAVVLLAPSLLDYFVTEMKQGMSANPGVFTDSRAFMGFVQMKLAGSIEAIWPILICLVAASVLAGAAVSGLNFAPDALQIKWDMINPATGLGKLVNAKSMVRLLTAIAKLFFVGLIVWLYIRSRLETFAALRWAWSGQIVTVVGKLIFGLMIRIGGAILVIGVADAFYQKWKYIKDLKMTRQEVKQERKDYEGSPEMKGRIRRAQLEMALRRISVEVPKASVVLVNPTHVAVALRYEADEMEAPILVAKGADHLAERIRQVARAHGVPVLRRPELARAVYATVKVGSVIPQSLYVAVAEVLAMIYRLRHSKR